MTLRIVPFQRRQPAHSNSLLSALAAIVALTCEGTAQEPAPQLPPLPAPPGTAPALPEKTPKADQPILPDESALIPDPILDAPRSARKYLRERKAEETSAADPVLDSPTPELPVRSDPDLFRDVAMNQALSTGDALLGGLGGLGDQLASPFSSGPLLSQFEGPSRQTLRPLRWKSLDFNVHGSVGVIGLHEGGGIAGDRVSAAPLYQGGFVMRLGRNKPVSLSASYDVGSSNDIGTSNDKGGSGGVDQAFSLRADVVFPDLKKMRFALDLRYAGLSGLDRDTGKDSKRQIATGSFIASYQYSDKTSFDWSISAPLRLFSNAVSSGGITSSLIATTDVSRKSNLGLGYTAGTVDVEKGEDQFYQQALVLWSYAPTRFLQWGVTAGLDFRNAGDTFSTTPIFGLTGNWNSGKGTLVTVSAERRVFSAASAINTNFTSSSIALNVVQRLAWGMIGSVSVGYEYSEYASVGTGGDGRRADKLTYVAGALVVPVNRHWSFSLSCAAGQNKSDVSAFDFVQGTLKTTLSF